MRDDRSCNSSKPAAVKTQNIADSDQTRGAAGAKGHDRVHDHLRHFTASPSPAGLLGRLHGTDRHAGVGGRDRRSGFRPAGCDSRRRRARRYCGIRHAAAAACDWHCPDLRRRRFKFRGGARASSAQCRTDGRDRHADTFRRRSRRDFRDRSHRRNYPGRCRRRARQPVHPADALADHGFGSLRVGTRCHGADLAKARSRRRKWGSRYRPPRQISPCVSP